MRNGFFGCVCWNQGILSSVLWCLLYLCSCWSGTLSLSLLVLSFLCWYGCCVFVLVFQADGLQYGDSPASHGNSINHCQFLHKCSKSFLFDGHPSMMYILWSCRCMSFCMVTWISSVVLHVGMSIVMFSELMHIFILGISSSLVSSWLCLNSKYAMYRSGPGLYIMYIF